MRFGVLGGGFGIYGWVPAIAELPTAEITTLQNYRPRFDSRIELAGLVERIRFVEDIEKLLDRSDYLIVARRPADQVSIVDHLVRRGWRGCVVLEKPLAPNPDEALTLLDTLIKANVRVAVGFTMYKTDWGLALATCLANDHPTRIQIDWNFLAHHYLHSLDGWKQRPIEGGGALRFFSVHLIGWLAQYGTWEARECSAAGLTSEDPSVTFSVNNGTTTVRVQCNTRWSGDAQFSVKATRGDSILLSRSLSDPFDEISSANESMSLRGDRRVRYLFRLLEDLVARGSADASGLKKHVWLWKQLEELRPASVSIR